MKSMFGIVFCVSLVAGVAVAMPAVDGAVVRSAKKSLLKPMAFAKTVDELTFAEQMDIKATGYEVYSGLTAYQYLHFVAQEEVAHESVEAYFKNEELCKGGDAKACAFIAENDEQTAVLDRNSGMEQETDQSYCFVRHPDYFEGQKLPVGMPVDLDLLESQGPDSRSGSIIRYTRRGYMASPYGCRQTLTSLQRDGQLLCGDATTHRPHVGVDVGMGEFFFQTPVFATADGVVVSVGWVTPSSGLLIKIKHDNGFYSQYMHLDRVFVQKGQQVSAGCAIGLMGDTGGNSEVAKSGTPRMGKDVAHLHYEIGYSGSAGSVTAPDGQIISIVKGEKNCSQNCETERSKFGNKIKPNDFMIVYEN